MLVEGQIRSLDWLATLPMQIRDEEEGARLDKQIRADAEAAATPAEDDGY